MKRVIEMTWGDMFLTKLAVFLASCWLIGLLAGFWPFERLIFLIENKWYLLLAAVIFAIIPVRRFLLSLKIKPIKKKR